MSSINRVFAFSIAVTAAASLVSAAFAQTPEATSTVDHSDLLRTADLVNLMRTVLDPNPAPVLTSPSDRAVSGITTADPASSIASTAPVVIMPDIRTPEEESREPDNADTNTKEPAPPATTANSPRITDADEDVFSQNPPFYYVFFFGEYVPYFNGWYYYSDRWLWGRRGPAPLEPPGWIPPPPPPPRPLDPFLPDIGPGPRPWTAGNGGGPVPGKPGSSSAAAQKSPNELNNAIPVVPSQHRIPRKNETAGKPLPKDTNIPVAPGSHRIPRSSR